MDIDAGKVCELIREAGHEPRGYSGRAMYGRQCVGVTTDDPFALIGDMLQALLDRGETDGELEMIRTLLKDTRTDSMGRSSIVYWPEVEWSSHAADPADEEEEG